MLSKKFRFNFPGGFPLTQEVLAKMQDAYGIVSDALAAMVGDSTGTYIVSGVNFNAAAPEGQRWSAGVLCIEGRIVPFSESGGAATDVLSYMDDMVTEVEFEDGNSHSVLWEYEAAAYDAAGQDAVPLANITRLQFPLITVAQELVSNGTLFVPAYKGVFPTTYVSLNMVKVSYKLWNICGTVSCTVSDANAAQNLIVVQTTSPFAPKAAEMLKNIYATVTDENYQVIRRVPVSVQVSAYSTSLGAEMRFDLTFSPNSLLAGDVCTFDFNNIIKEV